MTIKHSIVSFLLYTLTILLGRSLDALALPVAKAAAPGPTTSGTYDITNYGAKTGGADIRKALLSAWREACTSKKSITILIPEGTWYLSQAKLIGPNHGPIELRVEGTVEANADLNTITEKNADWITINYVNHFTLTGGGTFDGKGFTTWKRKDCHKNSTCAKFPYNFSLNFLNNSIIKDVTTKDSKNSHLNLLGSHNVTFLRFNISTPNGTVAPNIDGIHMGRCSKINILDSTIKTGDECVSIDDETSNLIVKNVTCGKNDVKNIDVDNCTFTRTHNGVRIKSWPSTTTKWETSNMRFENNISNPVIIDQEYCPHGSCDKSNLSRVKITNVTFNNIKGRANFPKAVTLVCSSNDPCDVKIGDIDIEFLGNVTTNFKPFLSGKQKPQICEGATASTNATDVSASAKTATADV